MGVALVCTPEDPRVSAFDDDNILLLNKVGWPESRVDHSTRPAGPSRQGRIHCT